MISNIDRQQLKQLIQVPQWGAFDLLIKELIAKYKDEVGARDSEWDTVRNLLINEGKVRGLTELTQELYLQIQQHEQYYEKRGAIDTIR